MPVVRYLDEDSSDLLKHNFIVRVIDNVAAYLQLDCNFSFLSDSGVEVGVEVFGVTSTICEFPKEAAT